MTESTVDVLYPGDQQPEIARKLLKAAGEKRRYEVLTIRGGFQVPESVARKAGLLPKEEAKAAQPATTPETKTEPPAIEPPASEETTEPPVTEETAEAPDTEAPDDGSSDGSTGDDDAADAEQPATNVEQTGDDAPVQEDAPAATTTEQPAAQLPARQRASSAQGKTAPSGRRRS